MLQKIQTYCPGLHERRQGKGWTTKNNAKHP